jgi:hypothetical protein
MLAKRLPHVFICATFLCSASCATQNPARETPVVQAEKPAPPPVVAQKAEPVKQEPEAPKEVVKAVESAKPVDEPKPPEPKVETPPKMEPKIEDTPKAETKPAAETFVVTEDLYKKTFSEIEGVITDLNKTIKAKDFDTWTKRLTPSYLKETGSADFLKRTSESPILRNDKIVLKSLKDYFLAVVVPSRSNVKLDTIDFVDQTHVKAITLIQGNPVLLYWLVKDADGWKIDIWKE